MLAGRGIHEGLTALWDCVIYKLVQYRDEKVKYVYNDTEKIEHISTFVKAAKRGEDIFQPFKEALEKLDGTQDIGNEDEGNEPSEWTKLSD